LRLGRRLRVHLLGGALVGRRLVEQVATYVLAPFMGGNLSELLCTLAICGCAVGGDGLGHCRI
jgi:hypothetical protein